MAKRKSGLVLAILALVAAGGAYFTWKGYEGDGLPDTIARGNGRIEAVEIDISARSPGRLKEIRVTEGDIVSAGDVLAVMDTQQLEARLKQAEAEKRRAEIGVQTAASLVAQRQAERMAAEAVVAQRKAQLDAARLKFARAERLMESRTTSQQQLEDDRAALAGAEAALAAANAQVAASDAAIGAAQAQVIDAEAAVEATKAAIDSIAAEIDDSTLKAPRDGRVQYRVAQPGEVVAAGGRVLNLVDLGDVYMAFFLPTAEVGRVAIGTEARLVLDAAPDYVIPATISFVADVAQFTPKTVETQAEREKLMFRVKAQISPALLKKYVEQVKTGLPGMAYVRLDKATDWPPQLSAGLVE